jgi:hypothetical protein
LGDNFAFHACGEVVSSTKSIRGIARVTRLDRSKELVVRDSRFSILKKEGCGVISGNNFQDAGVEVMGVITDKL